MLAGTSSSDASGDKSEEEVYTNYWIVKLDTDGNKLWDKTLGGSLEDRLFAVTLTADGGYLLAGQSRSNASGDKSEDSKGSFDLWIIKVDEHGQKLWDKTYGSNSADGISDIIPSLDGGYLLAGNSDSPASGDKSEDSRGDVDYWVVKIGENGNKQWDKTLGGDRFERIAEVTLTADGGYLLGGSSHSRASGDKSESIAGFWIVKIIEAEEAFSIKSPSLVNTDKILFSLQDRDMIHLSALGNPHFSVRANTDPIAIDSVKLELSGPVSHTQVERRPYALYGDDPKAGPGRDFIGRDWQQGTYTLTATPYHHDRSGSTATISFSVINSNINARLAVEVYPVPTQGNITITHEGITEDANMMLMDFSGNVVLEKPLSRQSEEQLDLAHLRKGIYYLKIVAAETVETKKIVLE